MNKQGEDRNYMVKGFCRKCGSGITEDDWTGSFDFYRCSSCGAMSTEETIKSIKEEFEEEEK